MSKFRRLQLRNSTIMRLFLLSNLVEITIHDDLLAQIGKFDSLEDLLNFWANLLFQIEAFKVCTMARVWKEMREKLKDHHDVLAILRDILTEFVDKELLTKLEGDE